MHKTVSTTNLLARKQDEEEEEAANKHCGVQLRLSVDMWDDLIEGKVQFFQREISPSGGVPDDTDNWELQYRLPF